MLWFQVLCEYFQECSRNLFFVFFLVLFFLTGAPAILMVGQVGAGVKESSGKKPGSGSGS